MKKCTKRIYSKGYLDVPVQTITEFFNENEICTSYTVLDKSGEFLYNMVPSDAELLPFEQPKFLHQMREFDTWLVVDANDRLTNKSVIKKSDDGDKAILNVFNKYDEYGRRTFTKSISYSYDADDTMSENVMEMVVTYDDDALIYTSSISDGSGNIMYTELKKTNDQLILRRSTCIMKYTLDEYDHIIKVEKSDIIDGVENEPCLQYEDTVKRDNLNRITSISKRLGYSDTRVQIYLTYVGDTDNVSTLYKLGTTSNGKKSEETTVIKVDGNNRIILKITSTLDERPVIIDDETTVIDSTKSTKFIKYNYIINDDGSKIVEECHSSGDTQIKTFNADNKLILEENQYQIVKLDYEY